MDIRKSHILKLKHMQAKTFLTKADRIPIEFPQLLSRQARKHWTFEKAVKEALKVAKKRAGGDD